MIRFLARTAGVTPPARLPAGLPKVVQKVLADLKKRNNFLLNMIIPALSKVKTWFGGTFFSADLTILTSVTLSILKIKYELHLDSQVTDLKPGLLL